MQKSTVRSILRENAWQLVMYALGIALCALWHWALALVYILLCGVSNILFMKWVCPYCAHYGMGTCKAGFHILSGGRFKPTPGRTFGQQFRRFVIVMVPGWLIPPLIGILLLVDHFSWPVLILLGLFCLVGFVILPKDARRHCEDCPMMDCPRRPKKLLQIDRK